MINVHAEAQRAFHASSSSLRCRAFFVRRIMFHAR
jgi:hypothetical protein